MNHLLKCRGERGSSTDIVCEEMVQNLTMSKKTADIGSAHCFRINVRNEYTSSARNT